MKTGKLWSQVYNVPQRRRDWLRLHAKYFWPRVLRLHLIVATQLRFNIFWQKASQRPQMVPFQCITLRAQTCQVERRGNHARMLGNSRTHIPRPHILSHHLSVHYLHTTQGQIANSCLVLNAGTTIVVVFLPATVWADGIFAGIFSTYITCFSPSLPPDRTITRTSFRDRGRHMPSVINSCTPCGWCIPVYTYIMVSSNIALIVGDVILAECM